MPANLTNAIAIDAAYYQSAALRANGTITNWGNTYGSPPSDLTNATAIAAGAYYVVALRASGQVMAWGDNSGGQTNVPSGLTNVIAIAAGFYHGVALRTDGSVAAWGWDGEYYGYGITNVPQGLAGVTAVAAGAYHTLALKADGTVVAWGADDAAPFGYGQCTVPSGLSKVVAIAAGGYHSLALKSDGTITVWGDLEDPPDGQGSFVRLGAGDNHALALRSGRLTPLILTQPVSQVVLPGATVHLSTLALGLAEVHYQWQHGGVSTGDATNSTLTLTSVQAADAGEYRAVVSTGAGSVTTAAATVTVAGPPQVQATTPSAAETNWVQAVPFSLSVTAAALGESVAPLTYRWQFNATNIQYAAYSNYNISALSPASQGDYTVTVSNAVGITNATWHVKVLPPGSVFAWGTNDQGQLQVPAGLTNVLAIAAGYAHTVVAKDDGAVMAWGDNAYGQTTVPANLSSIMAVAAGTSHSLALSNNGGVKAWGRHDLWQTNVPTDLTNAIAISAGGQQSLALRKNGTVVQWGQTNGTIPSGLTNVTAIASGTNFHLALSNATVIAWGSNDVGQITIATNLTNVVAVAAGGRHALALKADGTVAAWGQNNSGQCTVPVGLSNVMAVAAGDQHSLALKNDGTMVAWGDGTYGQTNLPPTLTGIKLVAGGGRHSLAAIFSPLVQYPVDVTKDLLLIYNTNTNSPDSVWVKDYYLTNRPMVRAANVLGVSCTNLPSIKPEDYTNTIAIPVQNWLATNPTKRPQYVILMAGLPWRVNTNPSPLGRYFGDVRSNGIPVALPVRASVQFQLHSWCATNWHPFVTSINMGEFSSDTNSVDAIYTNACKAYIDKLANIGTNTSVGSPFLSASAGGYLNTNLVFDKVRYGSNWSFCPSGCFPDGGYIMSNAVVALQAMNLSGIGITYAEGNENTNPTVKPPHITSAVDVAGYMTWGEHSLLGGLYPTQDQVQWQGNSGWYLIETLESFNGLPGMHQGDFFQWYSIGAFGGAYYSNTPVGVTTHTDEPNLDGVNDCTAYFGLWSAGKNFAICAWNSRMTPYFQAVGDPFVRR